MKHLVLLTLIPLLVACTDCEMPTHGPLSTGVPMHFGVAHRFNGTTRALINDNDDLQNACDVTQGGQAIGFWVDYINVNELEAGNREKGVDKNHLGSNQQLKYYPEQPEALRWDFDATSDSEKRYWLNTGRYLIRAFFPRDLQSQIVPASTDALLLTMQYNTHQHQHDLMVASNEVVIDDYTYHNGTPSIAQNWNESYTDVVPSTIEQHPANPLAYGYSQPFALSDAVPLKFRHALAAVQVRFMLGFDFEDELLGIEFVNGDGDAFHTVGNMLYGDDTETYGLARLPSLADRQKIRWSSFSTETADRPFYQWIIDTQATADQRGSVISRHVDGEVDSICHHRMPVAFAQRDHYYALTDTVGKENSTEAVWTTGSKDLPLDAATAELNEASYNENDGWLLVIPQPATAAVKLRAYFKKLGTLEVLMPSETGTDIDGNASISGDYLAAGHKYLYTIIISGTDVLCSVKSSPWNEWWASEEIVF